MYRASAPNLPTTRPTERARSARPADVRVIPDRSAWHACLSAFSVRNAGRGVCLDIGDAAGVRGRIEHRRLVGVGLVHDDAMLRATLAAPGGDEGRIEYSAPAVSRLVVEGHEGAGDLSLRVEYRGGWATLTFTDADDRGGAA